MSIRKLPILGLLALAAACGGGDEANDTAAAATATDTAAMSGTPTVTTTPAAETPAPAAGAPATPDAGGQVHEVRMVTTQNGAAGQFEPATLTVKKGDVIRWVMAESGVPHNVSFTSAQGNPAGFAPPADSPLYTQAGQTYEFKVDWNAGTYHYVCVPHSMMGMQGSVTVQ